MYIDTYIHVNLYVYVYKYQHGETHSIQKLHQVYLPRQSQYSADLRSHAVSLGGAVHADQVLQV